MNKSFTIRQRSQRASFINWPGLLAVVFICIAAYGLVSYGYSQIAISRSPVKNVTKMASEIESLKKENRKAELYKKWADDIIFKRLNYNDIQGRGANAFAKNLLDGPVHDESLKAQRALFSADDFAIRRINLALDFDCTFKLVNTASKKAKQNGYLFVVASNHDVIPPIYKSWPQSEVDTKTGLPQEFAKGDSFSVRYLKTVTGRIQQPLLGPKFNRIDLVAYSDSGKIILNKGYYIERMLHDSYVR